MSKFKIFKLFTRLSKFNLIYGSMFLILPIFLKKPNSYETNFVLCGFIIISVIYDITESLKDIKKEKINKDKNDD